MAIVFFSETKHVSPYSVAVREDIPVRPIVKKPGDGSGFQSFLKQNNALEALKFQALWFSVAVSNINKVFQEKFLKLFI